MKNKIGVLTLTGVLALTAAFSMTAFADEVKKLEPENSGSSIIQGDIATADIVENTSPTKAADYVTNTGKIESVEEKDDSYTITVGANGDDMGIIYHVQKDAFVVSRKDNKLLQLSDLKAGMEITGIVKGNAPQTMSIPPQTPGAIGFVLNDAEGSLSVGPFDAELVNMGDSLKLNIGDDTVIVDQKGTKKTFTAEDLKNSNLLVLYTVTTRSIPAQTNPSFVMVLDAVDVIQPRVEGVAAEPVAEPVAAASQADAGSQAVVTASREMVALRGAAEASGYSVNWTGNDKPVVLEKGGISISVTVGQTSFQKNGITLNASDAAVLKDSQIYIAADVADQLK